MSNGYIVYFNATLRGVLEDKDEYQRFMTQRGHSNNFDIVKLKWKEILKVLEQENLGSLQPVIINGMEDIVVFANEYESLIEYCYMELDAVKDSLNDVMGATKSYLRLDEDELHIINGTIIVFNKLLSDAVNKYVWFEDPPVNLDLRPFVEAWVEAFNYEEDFI